MLRYRDKTMLKTQYFWFIIYLYIDGSFWFYTKCLYCVLKYSLTLSSTTLICCADQPQKCYRCTNSSQSNILTHSHLSCSLSPIRSWLLIMIRTKCLSALHTFVCCVILWNPFVRTTGRVLIPVRNKQECAKFLFGANRSQRDSWCVMFK